MPKNRNLCALILLPWLQGCASSGDLVYVDMRAVERSIPLEKPRPDTGMPPKGLAPKTVSVPGTAPVRITVGSDAGAVVEQNRRRAERELARALADEYVHELDAQNRRQIAELEPRRRQAESAARDSIRTEFERYAKERAPKVARLSSIVGFPDPNPRSLPPRRPVEAPAQRLLEEARVLRGEIDALDRAYEERVRQLVAAAQQQYDVELTNLQAQLATARAQAVERAETAAAAEVRTAIAAIRPRLIESQEMVLPGQPAESQTIPGIASPPPTPDVKAEALSPEQRRRLLESQLEVWLAAHGYLRSNLPTGARDATAEFIRWRQQRRL